MMKWIVITSPDFLPGEASFIEKLLDFGVDLIHLRKPAASKEQCAALLDELPCRCHPRIVTHEHFSLCNDFDLHGIHLNRRNPAPLAGFNGSVSCSCHSLDEVERCKENMDYVFLSPIFNSISKQGYMSSYTDEALDDAARRGIIGSKVVALGGVTAENIGRLRQWNFGGAAFLGDIWSRKDDKQVDCYLRKISDLLL